MADNFILSLGSQDGITVATDDVAGVHYPISKLAHGALDSATIVSSTSGLPVAQQGTWNIGTVTTVTAVTAISNALPAGNNNIGDVDAIQSGTWTVELGATDNAVLDDIAADTEAIKVAAQLLDNAVYVDDADWTDDTSSHYLVGGVYQSTPHTVTDGDVTPFLTDVNGRLAVVATDGGATISIDDGGGNISIDDGGNTITVDGTVAVTHAALTELGAAIDTELQVDVVGALPAGDNVVGRVKLSDGSDVADILDLTNSNPLTVAIVDGDGSQITSFGGGTQYTEDAAAAANPVGTALNLIRNDTPGAVSNTDGDNVAARGTNYGALYVTLLDSQGDRAVITAAGSLSVYEDNSDGLYASTLNIETAVELIDDAVYVDDADWTDNTSKHLLVGGVYQSSPHTVTDGDVTPFLTDVNGRLATIVASSALPSGAATSAKQDTIIGHVDGIEGLLTTIDGDTGTIAGAVSGTEMQVDVVTSALPSGAATSAKQDDQTTALQLIDDIVYVDDTATHATGTSKGALIMAAATPTDASVSANDIGAVAMTTDRKMHVAVMDALPAGTNAIGKLAANSGVDIGDVDVTSISAGSNLIGDVGLQGRTTGGLTTFRSIDLDESEEEIKGTAGTVYSVWAFNRTAAPGYLKLYNDTAANVSVGSTTPQVTAVIPANADSDGAGFVISVPQGIAFSSAICAAVTTGVADADTGAPGANDFIVNIFYK